MRRTWLVALALFAALSIFGSGCGHNHDSGYYVSTGPGTYEPFTITLVNHTNMTLLPGPLMAQPYDTSIPASAIDPGGSATYAIGYLPSSITVGAAGEGAYSSYVYPTTTLYLGIDYFSDATGATFYYH